MYVLLLIIINLCLFNQSEFQDSLASGCEYIDEIELPCVTSNYDQTHDNARLQNGYGPTNNYQRSDTNISSAILSNHNVQDNRDNCRKRKFSIRNIIFYLLNKFQLVLVMGRFKLF